MKVVCTQENLKNGILAAGRIISTSNTLPVLNNILLKTENGMLKISSTNLEVAIVNLIRCKVEEEGETTVLAKTFIELVNSLPNKNINLESKNGLLSIEAENYHTSIKTLSAEEFPLIPEVEKKSVIEVDAQELKSSIDQVVFAVSTNQTQPEISGVYLRFNEKELKIVATDRYRLAEKKVGLKKSEINKEIIIPQKTILEISRIIGNSSGNVEMAVNETQVAIKFKETEIISRLIDGQYPDYEQIIPSEFKTIIVTEKQPLMNAVKAAGIFSQGSNSVKLEYKNSTQTLILSSESPEIGKSEVELSSKIEGGDGEVFLNNRYVTDCLLGMEGDNVVIKVIDDSSPSLIIPEKKQDYLYLVMPIKS